MAFLGCVLGPQWAGWCGLGALGGLQVGVEVDEVVVEVEGRGLVGLDVVEVVAGAGVEDEGEGAARGCCRARGRRENAVR